MVINGHTHYAHDIEATAEKLAIIAERAAGTVRADPAPAIAAIRTAVAD
jgi:hypothetical protein